MKILFLTTVLPGKKQMGSEVASQAVIDALCELGNEVTVIGYTRANDDYPLLSREVCAGKRPIETKHAGLHSVVWLASSLIRRIPYSVAKYHSSSFIASVRKALSQVRYDVILIDHVQMNWLVAAVPIRGKLIGLTHNIEHQMYQSFSGSLQGRMRQWVYRREARLLKQMELNFARGVDQLWTLTESDAAFFAAVKTRGEVKEIPLPASVTIHPARPAKKDFDVGLIGSWSWRPNEEGLRWFFDAVYPHLRGGLDIHVAGSGAGWLKGRYANVTYHGYVEDAQAFLGAARVVAIPTLRGGGIQVKTLDAIASGAQVVATPLAMRGISHPPNVAIAQTPAQFAQLVTLSLTRGTTDNAVVQAAAWSRVRHARFRTELNGAIRALGLN